MKTIKFIKKYINYNNSKIIGMFIFFIISAFIEIFTDVSLMYLINSFTDREYFNLRNQYIIIFISFVLINSFIIMLKNMLISNLSNISEQNLFNDVINNGINKKNFIIKTSNTGKIQGLLVNRINNYRMFLRENLENILYKPIVFVFSIITVFILNLKIGLIITFVIVVSSVVNVILGNIVIPATEDYYDAEDKLFDVQKEVIEQYNMVWLTGSVQRALNKVFSVNRKYHNEDKKLIKKSQYAYIPALLNEYLPMLILFVLIIIEIHLGKISYGKVLAMISIISGVSLPLTYCLRSYVDLKKLHPFINDVTELLDPIEYNAMEVVNDMGNKLISIENVKFKYDDSEKEFMIKKFVINKGDKVAILGKSGAGKTTLIKIILGFEKINTGKISINGGNKFFDIDGYIQNISYIDNNTYIFNDSLKYNIVLNNEYNEEKYKKIIDYLNLESIDKDINQFGNNLSGGQKMRICVARALYNSSDIIILDEPVSSLDKDSEKVVIELLKEIDATLIIISHRKSIIEVCNRFVKVENGIVDMDINFEGKIYE